MPSTSQPSQRRAGLFALAFVIFLGPTACSANTPSPLPTETGPSVPVTPAPPAPLPPGPVDPSLVDVVTIDLTSTPSVVTDPLSPTTTARSLDNATTRFVTKVPVLDERVTLTYTVRTSASATVTHLADGSVAILDDDEFVAGFLNVTSGFTDINLGDTTAPWIDITPKRSATGDRWQVEELAPGEFAVSQQIAPATGKSKKPRKAAAVFGTELIEGTQWSHLEGGKSLMVSATTFGRLIGTSESDLLQTALIRGVPKADTTVMAKQLRCHAEFAPTKTTWNLEPWRPDVSYLTYLLAKCNPVAQ